MSCGVGHRQSSDLALLWLWYRLAAAPLIQPLAWEPLYAEPAALKKKKSIWAVTWHQMVQGRKSPFHCKCNFSVVAEVVSK